MKAKVTRPDGTVVEFEGEAAEVADAVQKLVGAPQIQLVPYQLPPWITSQPIFPTFEPYTVTIDNGAVLKEGEAVTVTYAPAASAPSCWVASN